VRALKGLDDAIGVVHTDYHLDHLADSFDPATSHLYRGWTFMPGEPHGFQYLDELSSDAARVLILVSMVNVPALLLPSRYEHAAPGYRASFGAERPSFTVPVLFDTQTQTIVNTESADIIEMLNREFEAVATNQSDSFGDLAPAELSDEMAAVDAIVYPGINDGVYRCGFARTQDAYDHAYERHWAAMDAIEARLAASSSDDGPFLFGASPTLSDVRLWTTLVRYDAVYYSHFKTSRTRLVDMPHLLRLATALYRLPGVAATVDVAFIKNHYFSAHRMLNPSGIVPHGPRRLGFDE